CTITYPNNGDEFEQGDTIVISVDADDNDGLIAEVRFYIDDIGVFSLTSFPYTYSWNTINETIGNHIIKVTVKDNGGGSKTDECTISIIRNATIVTTDASLITHNSAMSGGNISDDGGSAVTARGVCWSTLPNPTISDEHTTDGSGTGSFVSSITGLLPVNTCYVRAYATNGAGTTYGNEISFTTLFESGTLTDTRDGHIYPTVRIGNQWWMAENLAYLPSISPHWYTSYTEPYYYVYGCEETTVSEAKTTINYQTYGVLYNWAATMDGAESSNTNPSDVQGVCPDGWHLPSDAEWK
ncbi:unnamed protein product, partial [marine sediment metagenome]